MTMVKFNKVIRVIALGTIFTLVTPFAAQAATTAPQRTVAPQAVSTSSSINVNFAPSAEASRFVKQLTDSGLAKEIQRDSVGNIVIPVSDQELMSKYHYNQADIQTLKYILKAANNNKEQIAKASQAAEAFVNDSGARHFGDVSPNLSFSSWTVHFSNSDIKMYLWAAIAAGPDAVILAITALATLTGGPIGTGLSLVWGVLGGASISIFMYYCTIAIANNKGVYIQINWDGVFPKPVIDTE
ncbi:hypothetical protein [Paenibacillus elgii]|uniref:hypothetical protein n=1 Tax=Paenibacillus elgii TaxID=189691 RepID=UPI00030AF5D7|nr:hypothetical protein [Paenibacillus elgii]